MWAVLKKEFKSYFLTPIGYVFIGLFLAIFSLIFYITTIYQGASTFQYVFGYVVMYGVVFLIPLLTMRMFAEERKNGTEQLLMTSPRSMVEITLGKFFAGVLVTVIAELLTFVYFGILCVCTGNINGNVWILTNINGIYSVWNVHVKLNRKSNSSWSNNNSSIYTNMACTNSNKWIRGAITNGEVFIIFIRSILNNPNYTDASNNNNVCNTNNDCYEKKKTCKVKGE